MAKDNPKSVAVQYKVHLKPTDVGLLVMKRMERPHLDKSAELRRFIELGYAAEQAGFILDGVVLRHAGRTWDTQPDFSESARPGAERSLTESHAAETPLSEPRKAAHPVTEDKPDSTSGGSKQVKGNPESSSGATTLRGNLRGLSG